nr:hypothetical protein BAR15_160003 [Bartonella sp. AR 15-3]
MLGNNEKGENRSNKDVWNYLFQSEYIFLHITSNYEKMRRQVFHI